MKATLVTGLLIGLAAAQETIPAPEVTNNKPGVAYKAVLTGGTETSIQGALVAKSAYDGTGVIISIDFSGFPGFDTSNYTYHIHAKKVPDDGNCTSAGPHLDPYHAGASSASPSTYKCDPTKPWLCELGDLSGKHGSIDGLNDGPAYKTHYLDKYLSTTEDTTAFIGNLSVVVHRKTDNKRLRCGNFAALKKDDTTSDVWSDWATTTKAADPTWTEWAATTTKKADPTWTEWATTTKKADPTWTEWATTTKKADPTWTEWATTTKKADPTWSDWSSTKMADPTWSDWSSTKTVDATWSTWVPTTSAVWSDVPQPTKAAATTVKAYTGGASSVTSGSILSIGGLITLIMATIL